MTPEENYADITAMQADWNARWRDKRRWIIVEEGDGTYSIHEHSKNGVAPPTDKPSKRDVAARLLQLLGIGPVAPQDYPERVCIGDIECAPAEVLQFAPAEGNEQILRMIRTTLDAPTFIDPAANCKNLTKTIMEIEHVIKRQTRTSHPIPAGEEVERVRDCATSLLLNVSPLHYVEEYRSKQQLYSVVPNACLKRLGEALQKLNVIAALRQGAPEQGDGATSKPVQCPTCLGEAIATTEHKNGYKVTRYMKHHQIQSDESPCEGDCLEAFNLWASTQGGNITQDNYEAWKAGYRTRPAQESGSEVRYRQALRCIASLDDDDAAILAKKVANRALTDAEDPAPKPPAKDGGEG